MSNWPEEDQLITGKKVLELFQQLRTEKGAKPVKKPSDNKLKELGLKTLNSRVSPAVYLETVYDGFGRLPTINELCSHKAGRFVVRRLSRDPSIQEDTGVPGGRTARPRNYGKPEDQGYKKVGGSAINDIHELDPAYQINQWVCDVMFGFQRITGTIAFCPENVELLYQPWFNANPFIKFCLGFDSEDIRMRYGRHGLILLTDPRWCEAVDNNIACPVKSEEMKQWLRDNEHRLEGTT